jgi:hypothetical protein
VWRRGSWVSVRMALTFATPRLFRAAIRSSFAFGGTDAATASVNPSNAGQLTRRHRPNCGCTAGLIVSERSPRSVDRRLLVPSAHSQSTARTSRIAEAVVGEPRETLRRDAARWMALDRPRDRPIGDVLDCVRAFFEARALRLRIRMCVRLTSNLAAILDQHRRRYVSQLPAPASSSHGIVSTNACVTPVAIVTTEHHKAAPIPTKLPTT